MVEASTQQVPLWRLALLDQLVETILGILGTIAKAIPSEWIRGIFNRHPGFNVEGTWYSELPKEVVKDSRLGRRVENFLTIKQHGVLLHGTMKKHTTEPNKAPKDEEFEFNGRLRDGLIYGCVEPKSGAKRFGAAVLIYQVTGDGNRLKGGQPFWDVTDDKVRTIEDRQWERAQKND